METDHSDTMSMEMLELLLKMRHAHAPQIFLSGGSRENKEKILAAAFELLPFSPTFFATEGTHRFLEEYSVSSTCVYRISDGGEPNPGQLLRRDAFDLVINVLTEDHDYDERTDYWTVRSLANENGIPLFTSVDDAIASIKRLVAHLREQTPLTDTIPVWDLHARFLRRVKELGGWACYHEHADKAYTITPELVQLGMRAMEDKWKLMRIIKRGYTFDDLVTRISRRVEHHIAQGTTHFRTLVDVDSIVGLLCVEAAIAVKEKYRGRIHFEIGIQPLEGVIDPDTRRLFEQAAAMSMVDVIGGLPSRDRPEPERHLDIILDLGRQLRKRVDIHTDQANIPSEIEFEQVARKTIQHGMQGWVSPVHCISLACKPEREMLEIIALGKDAGLTPIICPRAAAGMQQRHWIQAPIHNSIGPVVPFLRSGLQVVLGADNVHDMFEPMVNGSMELEVVPVLFQLIRYFDLETIARMATDKSLFRDWAS